MAQRKSTESGPEWGVLRVGRGQKWGATRFGSGAGIVLDLCLRYGSRYIE